jgi:hypothetical protein
MHLDRAAAAVAHVESAVQGEQRFAADVGDHFKYLQAGYLPEVDPLQGHARGIGSQDLL